MHALAQDPVLIVRLFWPPTRDHHWCVVCKLLWLAPTAICPPQNRYVAPWCIIACCMPWSAVTNVGQIHIDKSVQRQGANKHHTISISQKCIGWHACPLHIAHRLHTRQHDWGAGIAIVCTWSTKLCLLNRHSGTVAQLRAIVFGLKGLAVWV